MDFCTKFASSVNESIGQRVNNAFTRVDADIYATRSPNSQSSQMGEHKYNFTVHQPVTNF